MMGSKLLDALLDGGESVFKRLSMKDEPGQSQVVAVAKAGEGQIAGIDGREKFEVIQSR